MLLEQHYQMGIFTHIRAVFFCLNFLTLIYIYIYIYTHIYKVLKFSSSSLCVSKWNHSQIHYNSFMGKVNRCSNGTDLGKIFTNIFMEKKQLTFLIKFLYFPSK